MRILFICHRLPYPPKRGGKIRPFNIIRHLTASGHRVTVASLARSEQEIEEGRDLRDHCEEVLIGKISSVGAFAQMIARLPGPVPSSMGYFYSRDLHSSVRAAARQAFDLVFVHCSSAAQYAKSINGAASILDFGDMDSQKWLDYSTFRRFPLSLGYWLEGRKLEREERRLASRFSVSTCTTRAELETLSEFGAAKAADWFPNGVDPEYFSPTEQPFDPHQICFLGRMDYYPNQQAMLFFCREALPQIQERRPETRLVIVGAEPSAEIRRLERLRGVEVTGTVPDVRPYVHGSALTVAPLAIARGTQNKILESMAMGVPVVSSVTAARGVDAIPDEHLLTAESAEEYRDQVLRILESPEERRRLSVAGVGRTRSNHSWPASMQRLDRIIQTATGVS